MKTINKSLLLVLCLLLSMGLMGCTKKESLKEPPTTNQEVKATDSGQKVVSKKEDVFTYNIIEETYTENEITLKFPQLTNTNNPTKADSINKAIQDNVKGILESFRSPGKDMNGLTLDLNYKIAEYRQKVISIAYQGYVHFKQAPYPVNLYNTQNIALGEVDTIPLKDIFTIDDLFVERFKTGMYSNNRTDLDLEKSGINLKELIERQYTNQELKNLFLKAEANYKMTEHGVIVSVEVPHALGDHLEMAINYELIEGNMIKSSPVWEGYLFIAN